jgi:hypothetical protein
VKGVETIVRTNGVELAVETFGRADDPAVLLIQGAADGRHRPACSR